MTKIEQNIRKQTVTYIRALRLFRTDIAVTACKQMFDTYGHLLTTKQYDECYKILYPERC